MKEVTRVITAQITIIGEESKSQTMGNAAVEMLKVLADDVLVLSDQHFEVESEADG